MAAQHTPQPDHSYFGTALPGTSAARDYVGQNHPTERSLSSRFGGRHLLSIVDCYLLRGTKSLALPCAWNFRAGSSAGISGLAHIGFGSLNHPFVSPDRRQHHWNSSFSVFPREHACSSGARPDHHFRRRCPAMLSEKPPQHGSIRKRQAVLARKAEVFFTLEICHRHALSGDYVSLVGRGRGSMDFRKPRLMRQALVVPRPILVAGRSNRRAPAHSWWTSRYHASRIRAAGAHF